MNECRWLGSTSIHLSGYQLEQILEKELSKLGLEHYVLMIINKHLSPVYQHVYGFTAQQMSVYEQHMAHDEFFKHYMKSKQLGQLIYMQEMLPMSKIRNPVFNDILVPVMQLHHSYSGLVKLFDDHFLMLSSHSGQELSFNANQQVQSIWAFLSAWGNYWVAQQKMSREFAGLSSSAGSNLLLTSLTSAEIEVLKLLAQGLDGSEVAQRRDVSKETVKTQIKQILHKTGCRHQNQLLSRYFSSGTPSSSEFMTLTFRSAF